LITPFHLAIPVASVEVAREFYGNLLGCCEGRSSAKWVDFNLFGHQLVCHEVSFDTSRDRPTNPVDGHEVPIPHFGVVLEMDAWQTLADKLNSTDIEFVIEPHIRFEGEAGEQATMFFNDPFGNALEFKSFKDINAQLFRVT